METSATAERSLGDVEIDLESTQYCCVEVKNGELVDSGLFLMTMWHIQWISLLILISFLFLGVGARE